MLSPIVQNASRQLVFSISNNVWVWLLSYVGFKSVSQLCFLKVPSRHQLGKFFVKVTHSPIAAPSPADESAAAALRERGNTSFKGGEYEAAVEHYWAAARLNPQEPALFNNLSLAYLKMGDAKRVSTLAQKDS